MQRGKTRANKKKARSGERAVRNELEERSGVGGFGSLFFGLLLLAFFIGFLVAFFLCFGLFFLRLGLRSELEVDPFDDGALSGIALTLVQANDSRVAAVAILEAGRNVFEENLGGIFLMQSRNGQTTMMDGAALAERDHFLGHGSRGFGFGQGGCDAPVFDQAADQVGEHGIAMLKLAAQFGRSFTMSHKTLADELAVLFGSFQQFRLEAHAQREAERGEFIFDFVE